MSETINHKTAMDKAIVDKLASILANSEYTQSIDISIKGDVECVPVIDYRITEVINPKEWQKGAERGRE